MHSERNKLRAVAVLGAALMLAACAQRDTDTASATAAGTGESAAPAASQVPAPQAIETFANGTSLVSCNLETANGQGWDGIDIEVQAGQELALAGWLVDETAGGLTTDWWLVFQTEAGVTYAAPFETRIARSDLMSLYPGIDVGSAGFEVTTRVPDVAAGRLSVFMAEKNGESRRVCGIGRGLVVKAK